jgi:hypothetical protein
MNEDILIINNHGNIKSSSSSKFEIFTKPNKLNLFNYIFEYLLNIEQLKISSLNSHIFNFIKNKKKTIFLRLIKYKYISDYPRKYRPNLNDFQNLTEKILTETLQTENSIDIKLIYEYLSIFINHYIFKGENLILKFNEINFACFLSNILDHLQFTKFNSNNNNNNSEIKNIIHLSSRKNRN